MKLQANVCIVVAVRLCNFSKILKECLAPEILGAIVRMEVASTSSLKTGTFYFLAIVFWLIFPSSSHSFATKIICCLKSQFLSSHWPFLGYLVTFRSFCLLGPISLYFLAHSVSLQQTQLLTTTWTCFTLPISHFGSSYALWLKCPSSIYTSQNLTHYLRFQSNGLAFSITLTAVISQS